MTDFLRVLPAPKTVQQRKLTIASDVGSFSVITTISDNDRKKKHNIPVYGERRGWVPKTLDDFDDGGAFPEITLAQFPLNMGREASNATKKNVALQTGPDGKLQYDAILKQHIKQNVEGVSRPGNQLAQVVHSKPNTQKPQWSTAEALQRPNAEDEENVISRTQEALDSALAKKQNALALVPSVSAFAPEYTKYTPNQQAPGHNANCAQRIIRMVEKQPDPIEPPKFRNKRLPRGPPSPPPPVHHSPPRKLTAKDQADWKIPPAVSNWKNQKGFTLPLDKRLQAEGRGLQEVTVNDKFAALTEALLIAERSAREEIRIRNDLLKQRKQRDEEIREQQLRELAARARAHQNFSRAAPQVDEKLSSNDSTLNHMTTTATTSSAAAVELLNGTMDSQISEVHISSSDRERQAVEDMRKREVEREFKVEKSHKKSKRLRDSDRDISEKIALGQAQPTAQGSLYDARLFNQTAGLDTGFEAGEDEKYNLYDKPLFADRSANGIYRFEKDRMVESVGGEANMPGFSGADVKARSGPVQFQK